MKTFARVLLLLSAFNAHFHAAKAGTCKLMAFNIFWDEDSKTKQSDSIKKISKFAPTTLTPDSAFQGLLVPKSLLNSKDLKQTNVAIRFVSLNNSKRAVVSYREKHKLDVWAEDTEYYLVQGFDGEKHLSSNKIAKPSRMEISIQFKDKRICQESIDIRLDE